MSDTPTTEELATAVFKIIKASQSGRSLTKADVFDDYAPEIIFALRFTANFLDESSDSLKARAEPASAEVKGVCIEGKHYVPYETYLKAALAQTPTATDTGIRCDDCNRNNPVWFAPNELWNLVIGGPSATADPGGICCPICFIERAENCGIRPTAWKLDREIVTQDADAQKALDELFMIATNCRLASENVSPENILGRIKTIRAALSRMAPQWQTIDTAPRDGTTVFVWTGDAEFPGRWESSWREPTESEYWVAGSEEPNPADQTFGPEAGWFVDEYGTMKLDGKSFPTHWMPLPAPPADREG